MAGIGVVAFIFDFFLRSWGILKINYEVLSTTHILLLFVLIAVALPFYLFISKLTSKIVNRKVVA
jgi:hypothetical protein